MNINVEVVKVSPIVKDTIDYNTVIFKMRFPKKVDFENSRDIWIFFLKKHPSGLKLRISSRFA
jgi:hypothetical protein